MKRKSNTTIPLIIMLLLSAAVWYRMPIDLMELDPNEVTEIVVFDGNTGKAAHITDAEPIQRLIGNWNEVEVRRTKPSVGYTGYRFQVTIYLSDGEEAGDWNNFILNSADTIQKDPFFYSVTEGTVDFPYLETIVAAYGA